MKFLCCILMFSCGFIQAQLRYSVKNAVYQIHLEAENPIVTITKNKSVVFQQGNYHTHVKMASWKHRFTSEAIYENSIIESAEYKSDSIKLYGKAFLRKTSKNLPEICHFYLLFWKEKNALSWKLVPEFPVKTTEISFESDEAEQMLGMGEQYSFLNLKGKKLPVWSEEQGIGRGDQPLSRAAALGNADGHFFSTNAAMPVFVTSKCRSFIFENHAYQEADFSQMNKIIWKAWSSGLSGKITQAKNPAELLTFQSDWTGKMPMLPDAMKGCVVGIQGGSIYVDSIVNQAIANGIPVTGIWIQDWVGKRKTSFGSRLWWNWRPDEQKYPNFQQWIEKWHQKGIQVFAYINPFIIPESEMGQEAKKLGYLIKDKESKDLFIPVGGFKSWQLDLSNPAAKKWIQQRMYQMAAWGLDGWMADFSEWIPADAKLFNGKSGLDWHHEYILAWNQTNREVVDSLEKIGKKIVFFNRAGWLGSAKYSTLFWTGDQSVSFQNHDGMPSALRAMLSSGLSGITLNHSDIGGYTNLDVPFFGKYYRKTDLFLQWAQMNIFFPVFRTHEGLMPAKNIQFWSNDTVFQKFRSYSLLHLALKPYFDVCFEEATTLGWPVVRQTWFVFHQSIFR